MNTIRQRARDGEKEEERKINGHIYKERRW